MKKIFSLAVIAMIALTSCKKEKEIVGEAEGKTTLSFDAKAGSADFALNTDMTINGKTMKFTKFRYRVSNVVLVKSNGSEYAIPNSYYLLSEFAKFCLIETFIVVG